jgi:hypothetical protein
MTTHPWQCSAHTLSLTQNPIKQRTPQKNGERGTAYITTRTTIKPHSGTLQRYTHLEGAASSGRAATGKLDDSGSFGNT